jgi:hypothetical protein
MILLVYHRHAGGFTSLGEERYTRTKTEQEEIGYLVPLAPPAIIFQSTICLLIDNEHDPIIINRARET